jgi:hypothetical protein
MRTITAVMLVIGWQASAQAQEANYDESKVPQYTLPDPLVMQDGTPVRDAEAWRTQRRPELLRLFEEEVYGRSPPRPETVPFRVVSTHDDAFGGKATMKQVDVCFIGETDKIGPHMTMLLFVPKSDCPAPAFLGLNFYGNHGVFDDPRIPTNAGWFREKPEYGFVNNLATAASRGVDAQCWPVEMIIDRGYALATIYYGDIDPDFDDGFQNGIHALFDEPAAGERDPAAWGSIAAWAWGLSRALDYLEQDADIDAAHVAVIGHSRLGKTALWAGATDERFALVISNNSGCGGAALSRRAFGETVERINTSFPHWFCDHFRQYDGREEQLPVDQHELIALIAPRPVYIASAEEDLWADPHGEFLSGYYADPVYRLLGTDGLGADNDAMPAVNEPQSSGTIGYHIRSGPHDVTDYDWEQYLNFADRHFQR